MLKGAAGMSPNPDFSATFQAAYPDKSTGFVISCQSGKRSMMACQALEGMGYTNLNNVAGGYMAWTSAGLPTE